MSTQYCTIYIVRHAQSEANAAKILGGNYPLTKLGKQQAAQLNKKLSDILFSHVYASDLVRSMETAEILSLARNIAIKTTEVLRERHFGKFDGRLMSEIGEDIERWSKLTEGMTKDQRFNHNDENGIENDASLIGRYFTFLREVSVANLGKNVLIVSHSNIMRTLLVHLGFASGKQLPRGSIENTGYIQLRSDGTDFFIEKTVGIRRKVVE